MSLCQVREVALEAIARARRGDGPTLIECETYRFRGHSLADPDELRSPGELMMTWKIQVMSRILSRGQHLTRVPCMPLISHELATIFLCLLSVNPEEKAHYAARDPIIALKKHLLETGMATEAELKVRTGNHVEDITR